MTNLSGLRAVRGFSASVHYSPAPRTVSFTALPELTAKFDRFGLYVLCVDRPAGLTSTCWVGDLRTIGAATDLEVFVNIAHAKRGDLKLTLTHPDGTTVTLRNPDAADATADHFVEYSHNTDTTIKLAPADDAAESPTGDPFGALAGPAAGSPKGGKSAQGEWTLTVQDTASGNTGDLLYWRVTVR